MVAEVEGFVASVEGHTLIWLLVLLVLVLLISHVEELNMARSFRGQPDNEHPLELSVRVNLRDMQRGGGGLDMGWQGYTEPMDFEQAARLMARFHDLITEFKS